MNNWFKNNLPHFLISGIFLLITLIYFSPALQNKKLVQNDVIQAQAMSKEIMDVKAKTGKAPLWTNQMFGGMPAYQIWAQYPSNITTYIVKTFKTIFPDPVDTIFIFLVGAYFLFIVLGINPWLSAIGAIAVTFSSYNFIIIEAGHSNKAFALAFFAPILAGILLAYKGKYWLGAALTALFLAVEIRANHIQMTYYLMLAVIVLLIIELVKAIREDKLKEYTKASVALFAGLIIAVGVNFGTLWVNYEYAQQTIRGKSELTSNKNKPANGLDKEYAYQWSQGVAESITFLIPHAYGGASGYPLDDNSEVYKTLVANNVSPTQAAQFSKQMPTYWGDKPFTSGPIYLGAIIVFLFVLGCFIVKGSLKWWLVIATILSLFLSFGKNLPFLSDLFFDYFPLYNKFRAVESILVIAGITVPILALLALKEIFSEKINKEEITKYLKYTSYGFGGVLLLLIALPSLFFGFQSANDASFVQQLEQGTGSRDFANKILGALISDRESMFRADAIRSFLFIGLMAATLWLFIQQKLKANFAIAILALLVTVDMWSVNKRYLNDDNFVPARQLKIPFVARAVDTEILKDSDPNFRVMDATINTFSNASTTYFHKTIGGYHAAKLQRYQDLIEQHLIKGNKSVLDMLNTKYFILADTLGRPFVEENQGALGHAWFVNGVSFVENADAEINALTAFRPEQTAIIDDEFRNQVDLMKIMGIGDQGTIYLTNYRPDHITYQTNNTTERLAVFSEIYYDKGWNAYINGKPINHFRANYVLRAMQIPAGSHKIEFKFEPKAYKIGETISLISSILLVLGLIYVLYTENKKQQIA